MNTASGRVAAVVRTGIQIVAVSRYPDAHASAACVSGGACVAVVACGEVVRMSTAVCRIAYIVRTNVAVVAIKRLPRLARSGLARFYPVADIAIVASIVRFAVLAA